MPLKIVSWNINSVRLRMPLIEDLIEQHQPDIICLQEIKCAEDQFPAKPLKNNGYDHFAVSGQKGYHGVATISKYPIVSQDKMGFCPKDEARHIHAKIEGFPSKLHKSISIHNFYVPAGGDIPDFEKNPKFAHKFEFLKNMENHFEGEGKHRTEPTILVGDLNIAPEENDVWSHKQMLKIVSHTPQEVEALKKIQMANDWIDEMREHVSDERCFNPCQRMGKTIRSCPGYCPFKRVSLI